METCVICKHEVDISKFDANAAPCHICNKIHFFHTPCNVFSYLATLTDKTSAFIQ